MSVGSIVIWRHRLGLSVLLRPPQPIALCRASNDATEVERTNRFPYAMPARIPAGISHIRSSSAGRQRSLQTRRHHRRGVATEPSERPMTCVEQYIRDAIFDASSQRPGQAQPSTFCSRRAIRPTLAPTTASRAQLFLDPHSVSAMADSEPRPDDVTQALVFYAQEMYQYTFKRWSEVKKRIEGNVASFPAQSTPRK
ncbi:hypothetical protein WOLCODRAFT_150061 [Wolfiporia cocos MD-104 SS10]|uniref:Uncharacterized protein n=1 Tax=Wolfiporia cocos (strain MD-104) TaxID=742152 RepID=A0A2H3JMH3_WOLCO|nr:hypothetical protein WOLCODRAFT_150061 [Wolfiporia cocos MD-104 SS10]